MIKRDKLILQTKTLNDGGVSSNSELKECILSSEF